LRLIDADRPYVVVDGSAGEVRLQHGAAVLRQCPVVGDSLSSTAQTAQKLTALLRRYRRTDPFHEVEPGPFDWEHYLVTQATDEAAMLFSGGLLLFASEAWEPARPPAIRLHTADLRALHDAAADSMDLVLLPAGWEEGR
jgi:hypothetical protein